MSMPKILRAHTWRPDPEVEKKQVHGDVTTRQMTPEEREKYSNLKPVRDSNGKVRKKPILKVMPSFDKSSKGGKKKG